ncbi:hypothetical protein BDZ94DRAFT_1281484 [Collybia nuda]|uniref:T6SS Phospholipase effector Tle1-like catalytic domain-containing protein n=1 Tax=Collybia nuda TaxID=64659 RepID=A0A9P5Y8E6_9AGAR|nr:hypothetical protein BDZ94DRAFT_1281484 [Collybia nuda]
MTENPTILSVRKARTIVLCFDGTSNEYDGNITNIVKFFALLKKDDFDEQLCYYQPGVGTWFNPGVVSPLFHWVARLLDEAFAWYLDAHVIDGYRFLMQNYRAGDKICIFGFSRGSYTARALAGVLHKVGLLPRNNEQQIPFAYKLYKREDRDGKDLCAGFKQTFCQNVKIQFVGVWDTVASVGAIRGRTLPFISSNRAIKTFRHALSLDEHRVRFRANYYHRPSPDENGAALDPEHASPVIGTIKESLKPGKSNKRKLVTPQRGGFFTKFFRTPTKIVLDIPDEEGDPTDVLEVWFSGCHADVGGGAVADAASNSLGNISLRWMVQEIMKSQCGVLFDELALKRASIPGIIPGLLVENNLAQQALEIEDALQPLHDELKRNVLWWILEITPLPYFWQDADGRWLKEHSFHLGRGRRIYDHHPHFHATVKRRMEKSKYTPRAQWEKGSEVYVH